MFCAVECLQARTLSTRVCFCTVKGMRAGPLICGGHNPVLSCLSTHARMDSRNAAAFHLCTVIWKVIKPFKQQEQAPDLCNKGAGRVG